MLHRVLVDELLAHINPFLHWFAILGGKKKNESPLYQLLLGALVMQILGTGILELQYLMEAIGSFIATSAPAAIFALQLLLHPTPSSNAVVVPSLGNAWKTGKTSLKDHRN